MVNKGKPKKNKLDDVLSAHSKKKKNTQAMNTAVDNLISENLMKSDDEKKSKSPPIKKPQKTIAERVDYPADFEDTSSTETKKEPSSEPKTEEKPIPKKEKAVPYIMVKSEKPPIKKSQKTIIERVDYPVDSKEEPSAKGTKKELFSKSLSEREKGPEKVKAPPQSEKILQGKRETEETKSASDQKKLAAKGRLKNSYWNTFFYDAGAAAKDLGQLLKHK